MPSLEVVIGLVLIILFYSLLATIIMELISSFTAMRGRHLEKTLRSMLSSADRREELLDDFRDNVLYQQLAGRAYGKKSPPSYLGAEAFRSILFRIIAARKEGQSFREKIEHLPDDHLKELLLQFWEEAGQKTEAFAARVDNWYNDVMDRASGWYKRNVQKILLGLGLVIAIVFNVDTVQIYQNLVSTSKMDLDRLVALAEAVSEREILTPAFDTLAGVTPDTQYTVNREVYQLIEDNIQELKDPLGIGWEGVERSSDLFFWLFKVFGWLITAVCISKGAPFWFDLLKKMVNFRDSGNLATRTTEPATAPARPAAAPEGHMEVIDKPVG